MRSCKLFIIKRGYFKYRTLNVHKKHYERAEDRKWLSFVNTKLSYLKELINIPIRNACGALLVFLNIQLLIFETLKTIKYFLGTVILADYDVITF